MIENGLCQCGCGKKTTRALYNYKRNRVKKGEYFRFVMGHGRRIPGHAIISNGYEVVNIPTHPRSHRSGYVFKHILQGERAIGKSLPPKAVIHHFPSIENFSDLVICQDTEYHHLLHVRYRAFIECGNPNLRKCYVCKQYDLPSNLKHNSHKSCYRQYLNEWRYNRKILPFMV